MKNIRQTKYGQVEGFVENGIFKCFGIPFAKPPIGELRFKRAMEPEPWSEVKECKKMSAKPCNFFASRPKKTKEKNGDESEDCLYLNVWSPKKAEKAPVFVWIYGGANHIGGSSNPEYDLESFADKGKTHKLNNELYLKGLKLDKENISKLREMSVEELAAGTKLVFENNKFYPGILIPGPVIDDLVPEKPWEALEKGVSKDIKCMFGTCKDDGRLFYRLKIVPRSWEELNAMLEYNNYLEYFDDFKKVYGDKKEKDAMNEIATDRMFLIDTMRCCLNQSKYNTVYSYRFDFETGIEKILRLNSIHGTDICPALDTWKGEMARLHDFTSKKRKMKIHEYTHNSFVNFIKTGDPNGNIPVKWNEYKEDNKEVFVFNDECKTIKNSKEDEFKLWSSLYLYQ